MSALPTDLVAQMRTQWDECYDQGWAHAIEALAASGHAEAAAVLVTLAAAMRRKREQMRSDAERDTRACGGRK